MKPTRFQTRQGQTTRDRPETASSGLMSLLLVLMFSTRGVQARAPIVVTDGPMAGSIYRREAFVITTDTRGLRFCHAAHTLTSLGFDVRPFAPIDVRDSRVLEMEEKYIRVNESVGMARRAISLTLTHAELWYAAPRYTSAARLGSLQTSQPHTAAPVTLSKACESQPCVHAGAASHRAPRTTGSTCSKTTSCWSLGLASTLKMSYATWRPSRSLPSREARP